MTPLCAALVLLLAGDASSTGTPDRPRAATASTTPTASTTTMAASPATAGQWSTVDPAREVPVLPMVPSGRAARLYAIYVGGAVVGAAPPGGSLIANIFPTPQYGDFSGAFLGGRAEAGVLWRRWLRAFATVESGVAAPGPLLPQKSRVAAHAVGLGGQFGAADLPWQFAPFLALNARLRQEELAVDDDRFVTGVLGVSQTFGVELRIDSAWVVRGGLEVWPANLAAFGKGRFVDVDGSLWRLQDGGLPGERADLDAFVSVLFEGVRQ